MKDTYEISWTRLPTENFINDQLIYEIVQRISIMSQQLTTIEKVILDAINHIRNISKRKLSLDNILQRINKISAPNLDTEALRSELEKMIFKGLIDQNYRVLNKENSQTNIDPSPDKVSFTIDGSTEDKTKIDFYEISSLIGAQDTPVAKARLDLDNRNKIDTPTTNASPDVS